jgi:DNA-binding protein YbaB
MLEQAQQMQTQLLAAQEELAAKKVDGTAGGVTVVVTGTGDLDGLTIPTGTFDGNDADSMADLQDLVVAAYRDAKAKASALAAEAMGPLAALGGDDPFGGGGQARPGGFGV